MLEEGKIPALKEYDDPEVRRLMMAAIVKEMTGLLNLTEIAGNCQGSRFFSIRYVYR